jgi:hypothetical protein
LRGQRVTGEDETTMTEITILPDGRLYVFGMSRPVLEMLRLLETGNPRLERLEEQLQTVNVTGETPDPDRPPQGGREREG